MPQDLSTIGSEMHLPGNSAYNWPMMMSHKTRVYLSLVSYTDQVNLLMVSTIN